MNQALIYCFLEHFCGFTEVISTWASHLGVEIFVEDLQEKVWFMDEWTDG